MAASAGGSGTRTRSSTGRTARGPGGPDPRPASGHPPRSSGPPVIGRFGHDQETPPAQEGGGTLRRHRRAVRTIGPRPERRIPAGRCLVRPTPPGPSQPGSGPSSPGSRPPRAGTGPGVRCCPEGRLHGPATGGPEPAPGSPHRSRGPARVLSQDPVPPQNPVRSERCVDPVPRPPLNPPHRQSRGRGPGGRRGVRRPEIPMPWPVTGPRSTTGAGGVSPPGMFGFTAPDRSPLGPSGRRGDGWTLQSSLSTADPAGVARGEMTTYRRGSSPSDLVSTPSISVTAS